MSEVLAIIAVILAVAIAVVLDSRRTKPDPLRVRRSIAIEAPAEQIFR